MFFIKLLGIDYFSEVLIGKEANRSKIINTYKTLNTHILIMKVSVLLSCVDWGHKIKMIHFTNRLYPH